MKKFIFSIALISFVGILVYSNTFFVPFQFDDQPSIVNNFDIRHIHNLQNIWDFLPRRFMLYLSLAFNYHFSRLHVFGYHLFNLAVHLVSAVLVWWLTLLTFSTPAMKGNKIISHAKGIALFAGLVFVAHPIQTQAVTYIVQRAASMATMFYVASLCCYVKSRLLDNAKLLSKAYYVLSFVAAIAAMFTKETAITLPLMIVLYEYSFLKTKRGLNWEYLAPFLLILSLIPVTMAVTESTQAQAMRGIVPEGPCGITPAQYLLTQFRVMATYIRLAFLPLGQNLDYDYPVFNNFFAWPVLGGFLLLTTILLFAGRLFLKYRLVAFSIFWFFITLMPESSILPIKDVINEHRLYLPMAGYSMLLVSGGYYLLGNKTFKTMALVFIMIISCYSVLTYQRNKIWRDAFVLWDDALGKSPNKARPNNNCGYLLDKEGKYAQALVDLNRAIEISPSYADAYNNRGMVYYHQGLMSQALADLSRAIEINPAFAQAYVNRGAVFARQGDFVDAIVDYNKALAIDPNCTQGYNNRGNAYAKQRKYIQAMMDFNRAVEIDPGFAQTYNNRAVVFYQLKEYHKAWDNLVQARVLGYNISPKFFNTLKYALGDAQQL